MEKFRDPQTKEEEVLSRLVEMIWTVFENDWEMTKACISDPFMIEPDKTFLHPLSSTDPKEERNNWWNRGGLLEAYRDAANLLVAKGIRRIGD